MNENTLPEASVIRPNIVFILADDLGYTDIAPYGSEVHTPSLSALAELELYELSYCGELCARQSDASHRGRQPPGRGV